MGPRYRFQWMAICTLLLAATVSPVFGGEVKGKVWLVGTDKADNAVVYLESPTVRPLPPPQHHAKMDQVNLQFIPHVLAILVGTTVDFYNSDDVLHNVFSPDYPGGAFNLGTWAKGDIRSYTFTKPGVATLLCNVHPEMEAYIVVLRTPYFAITGTDGTYHIVHIPAGHYTIKIWHEKQSTKAKEVDVPAKGTIIVNFHCHLRNQRKR